MSVSVNAQAPVSTGSSDKAVVVEVKTDKVRYTTGERIRFTVLLVNRGTSPVYIAKSFLAAGGGMAGFSLSIKQTEGKSSPECPIYMDRFFDTAGPRSDKQILKEDFLWLAPGRHCRLHWHVSRLRSKARGFLRTHGDLLSL
jgi:hypothetical protein